MGVAPDTVTFNTLINAAAKRGRLGEADARSPGGRRGPPGALSHQRGMEEGGASPCTCSLELRASRVRLRDSGVAFRAEIHADLGRCDFHAVP